MKKLFLIPLMTLLTCVMAFATVRTAGTYAELQNALSAANDGDVIELTADIEPTSLLNITKSITLDGGANKYGIKKATNSNCYPFMPAEGYTPEGTAYGTALAINYQGNPDATLDVTIRNFTINVSATAASITNMKFGIIAFDGVAKLNIENSDITANGKNAITVTGKKVTPITLKISNTPIVTGTNSGYPIYMLKPTLLTMNDCNLVKGYCGLYFKYRSSATGSVWQTYGNVAGSRGSIATCTNCDFVCYNTSHGNADNDFGIFAFEDDGIDLTLNNCGMNATAYGDEWQSVIYMKNKYAPYFAWNSERTEAQPVNVTINGANSHINGRMVARENDATPNTSAGLAAANYRTQLNFTITGGTYAQNVGSDGITYPYILDETTSGTFLQQHINIPAGYTVNTIDQGGTTLYRVVPEINVSYDINEKYEEGAKGDNPNTSFIVDASTELVNNQTEAAYVQVKENGTVLTVGKEEAGVKTNQTLVINNGLDVQDNAIVKVQAGSALVIGEGGIATSKPENIIIQADKDGAASLLLDPTITVNQTPELTVKMTVPAEHAGYDMHEAEQYRHWFRFAMPVQHMAAIWAKEPNVPTYLYGWDYANQKWSQVGVTEMVPFAGYTLSPDRLITNETGTITYTFKGQLLGNTNCTLNLNHHGYNFFGNSYTGYISILKLVDQIMGDAKIDGTVWMWDGETYQGVPLGYLRDYGENDVLVPSWKKEVAPMQTFVLRLTGSELSSTDINYADAIWGNPRYDNAKSALNAAPARRAEINDNAIISMSISANGQKESIVLIENGVYSDAYDRGYDAIKYMNENSFNTYVGINGENYGTVATDNLEGKMLNIKTNNELAYTMTFDFVAGEEYALRDNATNQVIAIEEGATYEFAAQPNSTVEGRFEIVGRAKMPTSIENTEVKANVKGIYTIMGQYLGEDFDILPAGVYVVNGVKIVK